MLSQRSDLTVLESVDLAAQWEGDEQLVEDEDDWDEDLDEDDWDEDLDEDDWDEDEQELEDEGVPQGASYDDLPSL